MPKLFNISASNCFVETLAAKLLADYQSDNLKLAEVLVLLPNRRACRSLAEAFVRLQGMTPSLLPQIKAIGDVYEDELILSGHNAPEQFLNIPPAIDPLERIMLFIRLIMGRYQEFGLEKISLAQACFLATELGHLIDTADLQNLNWNNLKDLVPDEYAAHWQETLKFLNIITHYWPDILAERNVIDSGKRKNILIEKQSAIWQQECPQRRIIIAGTTAVSSVMKQMVQTVLNLLNGEVYLSGLDKFLDDSAWEKVDETHPQFELKQLLEFLNINRQDIPDIIPPQNTEREKLISEIMRPAACSHEWRNLKNILSSTATENLRLLECPDTRLEALNIALIMRRALETKETTIALITPDRTLARRVAAELKRWQIIVDDSAGIPLAQTPWGIFMRLIIAATTPDANKAQILSLFKNNLFALGQDKATTSRQALNLDKKIWRSKETDEEANALLQKFYQAAADFTELLGSENTSLEHLLKTHTALAETLAADNKSNGAQLLWQNEDGEAGADFIANWLKQAAVLGDINPREYLDLFEAMMTGIMVRSSKGSHPRIKILGPMEARLNHFNEIILGGFNEGIWPPAPPSDPWMSRPMKHDFGFEQPEKQIGVLGLDFANLLGAQKVYLTRSCMDQGTPTVKSRWWMRLETVLQAANLSAKEMAETDILTLAENLDKPSEFIKISPPAPKPPVSARPRKLSASAFEKLLRDPYGVFAEYILKLKPLDELEQEPDGSDFGNIVHQVLEDFGNRYPCAYPDNALDILLELGNKAFQQAKLPLEKQAFWQPKFAKMATWIVNLESKYRTEIKQIHNEVWGKIFFDDAPAGRFEIYAKADRVDETFDGKINIVDYKTGRARTATEVKKGYAPQLPIEGLIAAAGGFDDINKADIKSLMYWKLGSETITIDEALEDLLNQTRDHISEVINLFDFETTGYLSRPNPKNAPDYSDYEHLARVKEWSVKEEGDD